jgi:hypothetical protein
LSLTSFPAKVGMSIVAAEVAFPDLMHASAALGGAATAGDGSAASAWRGGYESHEWKAVTPDPHALRFAPERFVDGAARATLLAYHVDPEGEWVALVGGVIGAMAASIADGRLAPEPEVMPSQHRRRVVAMRIDGYGAEEIDAFRAELQAGGVFLLTVRDRGGSDDMMLAVNTARVAAHNRVTDEMRALELAAIAGASGRPDRLTLVDGNVGPHLTAEARHGWPMVGVIKRHHMMPLPSEAQQCVLSLRGGQRSPAFVIEPPDGSGRAPMVSWYLRIGKASSDALAGVIRCEASRPFVEAASGGDVSAWVDGLSLQLRAMRAVRGSYSREDCSLHPVLMIEDRLHSKAGAMELIRSRLSRDLGL